MFTLKSIVNHSPLALLTATGAYMAMIALHYRKEAKKEYYREAVMNADPNLHKMMDYTPLIPRRSKVYSDEKKNLLVNM